MQRITTPWECSQYEGEAQTRCLNAFVEVSAKRLSSSKANCKRNRDGQPSSRTRSTGKPPRRPDLQRQFSDRPPVTTITPIPYGYPYAYSYWYPPSLGLGLYLGRPWVIWSALRFSPLLGPAYHYRPWRHGR